MQRGFAAARRKILGTPHMPLNLVAPARRIQQIRAADLHDLALRLHPDSKPATRNRWVLRPCVTILHHAANAGLCHWLKVPAFKEPRPVTRA